MNAKTSRSSCVDTGGAAFVVGPLRICHTTGTRNNTGVCSTETYIHQRICQQCAARVTRSMVGRDTSAIRQTHLATWLRTQKDWLA